MGGAQAAPGPRTPGNQSRRFAPSRLGFGFVSPLVSRIDFLEGESFAFPLPTVAPLPASDLGGDTNLRPP